MTIDDLTQLFIDYYGEENVDSVRYIQEGDDICSMANWQITVHWKNLLVTNEYNNSIKIYDLFAKIPLKITDNNEILIESNFLLCRSTATKNQYKSGYIHSHVPKQSLYRNWKYQSPCLGQGPIKGTLHKLWENSNDVDIWRLFIWELDKYVHVESLVGSPYIKMSCVTDASIGCTYCLYKGNNVTNSSVKKVLNRFIEYIIINKLLAFTYCNLKIKFAYTNTELILKVSNYFIDFINKEYKHLDFKDIKNSSIQSLFMVCSIYDNGNFYDYVSQNLNVTYPKDYTICTFKGEPQYFKVIEGLDNPTFKNILLLKPKMLSYVCVTILTALNKYYGKIRNN